MGVSAQITYNLKPQLAALWCTGGGTQAQPLCMGGPLFDVRIMAWLARPDSSGIVGDDDSRRLPKVLLPLLPCHICAHPCLSTCKGVSSGD